MKRDPAPGVGPFGGELLRRSRPNAPNISKGLWNNEVVLVKCYGHCAAGYRQTVGRWAMEREWWALNQLAESGRTPRPKARPRPWTVVMEWVDGTPLERVNRGEIPASHLLHEAETLLAALSRHGIAHADLGHDHWGVQGREANVLLTPDRRLVAIDFAGCWRAEGGRWPGQAALGRALQLHDQLLLTKILYHLGDPTVAEHPAWRQPSERSMAWWELMKLLGKL